MQNKNTLARFFAGLALMIVGLFILFNRVHVGQAGWGGWGRFSIGNFSFPSGLVFVPFIIGVVWMFGSGGSMISKIFTIFSVLIILAAIIMNTTFWMDRMKLFDWLLILVMIFGGGGIVASVLFGEDMREMKKADQKEENGKDEMKEKEEDVNSKKIKNIEEELEHLKRTMDNHNINS